MGMEKEIEDIHHAVFGNGREGLVSRVSRVEAVQQMQMRADDDFRVWIRKMFYVVIFLAVCAGASPWAGSIIGYFEKLGGLK